MTIEMTLPDMTCGHCVRTVTETIQRVDPLAQVKVELPEHRVKIDSSRAPAEFAAALTEEGYTPA